MTCSERVSQWDASVSSHLPHLSRPQAGVLALWSLGMVLACSCGLSQVSVVLAMVLGQPEATLRQRLREWYYPAQDKAGKHRRTLEVESCFAPLLRWVLVWWPDEQHMVERFIPALCCVQRNRELFLDPLLPDELAQPTRPQRLLEVLFLGRHSRPQEWCGGGH